MQLKTINGSKVEYVAHSKNDKTLVYVRTMDYILPILILDLERPSQELIKEKLQKDLAEGAEFISI